MLMATNLTFSCLEDSFGGLLPPEYVSFFYYDICIDKETDYHHFYDWSIEVEDFLKRNNTLIEVKDEKDLPTSVKENEVYFSFSKKDNQNKAAAFFRHLRNAFSHFSISYDGKCLCLKDSYFEKGKTKITMIGKIDQNAFNGLMNIFFKQKRVEEEKYNKNLYPEL